MTRGKNTRAHLVLIAAALLVFVVVQVAFAGSSGGPTAESSAGVKSKLKRLTRQVATLSGQVATLNGQVAALQAKQGSPAPPTGPAGGDLTGTYPAPSLTPPPAPTSAGLADVITSASCSGLTTNNWYDAEPTGNNSAGYYRDRQGRVFIQGVILKCGAAPPATIFTLPAGFRPAKAEAESATGIANTFPVTITSSGAVQVSGTVSGDFFSLDGINFRCAPSGANGCP